MGHYYLGIVLTSLIVFTIETVGRRAEAAISGTTTVASGLSAPIFITHAPGDRDRLFIAERGSPGNNVNATAAIKILDLNTGNVASTPFLTIPGIDNFSEGGLLGMAFHPDYSNPGAAGEGKFYVYVTTDPDGSQDTENPPLVSEIREYSVSADPNIANSTFNPILSWSQPQSNHNAGWIGFSPNDHYLYISSGDGGGGGDSGSGHTPGIGNAQDITNNLLGKMLRIDVDGDDFLGEADRNYAIPADNPFVGVEGDDEIWAYGLRNPFRDSFDRLTGDLWIGDVGQGSREEINFQPADSNGGENYGWRLYEGNQTFGADPEDPFPDDYVPPVYDYDRDFDPFGGSVVTGGYAYRGPDPSLQGMYFFLDSRNSGSTNNDNYWLYDPEAASDPVSNIDSLLSPGGNQFPVSFGEDAKGNLYIAYLFSGTVLRIDTDERLPGDYDADGDVDGDDYQEWADAFGTDAELPDGNGNGVVDAADYTVWRDNLGSSVHNLGGASVLDDGQTAVPEPTVVLFVGQLVATLLVSGGRRRLSV